MFGSIFTGLSGMQAFSSALRQISNNITNINSTGFKSSAASFSGLFGLGDQARPGNSEQGVALGPTRIDFAQGELRQTDRDLDLAVDGEGFLVLLKDADLYFARTGSFEVNDKGDIVLSGTDYRLTVLNEHGEPVTLNINQDRTSAPQATKTVTFTDNLSSTATSFDVSSIKVFDAAGASDTWRAHFARTASDAPGDWTMTVTNGQGAEIANEKIHFINGIIDPSTATIAVSDTAAGRSVNFDFSHGVTSFSAGDSSTLSVSNADGFGPGDLLSVAVNDKGILQISYSNGQKKDLGAVTLAWFQDKGDLEQRSDGALTDRQTRPVFMTTANDRVGTVTGKRLEASNVDLSREFGELILVQRGFQASSQVVSVSNDMIQQLFGIRGQG
ncbi:MAG: flagellar hook-basal body complex protein [Terricaulis sp.]